MRLAVASAALWLLVPATAAASTASVTEYQNRISYAVVSYSAGPGEANDLTVKDDGHSIVLTDPGATIVPGAGCEANDAHSVTCTSDLSFEPVEADLGDEEDHFTSEGPSFSVDGGPGNDTLEGGAAGGTLSGGEGADDLEGGAHTTSFDGGEGDDTMIGTDEHDHFTGGPGADTMDGRGQVAAFALGDTVDYSGYTEPVTIDMSTPGSTAGAPGEGDTISNMESAIGGDGADTITAAQEVWSPLAGSLVVGEGGDDVIRGGPSQDELHGEGGNDTIDGAGGDDFLGGGGGRDTIHGGAGSNTILGFDDARPERDSIDCGDGGTVQPGLAGMALRDVIDQSCGQVRFEYLPIRRVRYGYTGQPTRSVATTLVCQSHCRVTIELHSHGRLVGVASRKIRRGHRATLTIALPEEVRDELAQAGELRLHYTLGVRWGERLRHDQATSWNLLLHSHSSPR